MRFTSFLKPAVPLFFIFLSTVAFAQKKPLDHSVYDGWKSLQSISISDDGRFAGAIISPQEGDSVLFVRDLKDDRLLTLKGVNRYSLFPDGKYTVGLIKTPFAERREARIKKKKADEMPGDSLAVIRNDTFGIEKIAGVKSFKTPEKPASHIAYSITQKNDTTKEKNKSPKPKELLVIRNVATQHEDTVTNVKEYVFSKFGNALAAIIEPDKKDSTDASGVLFFDLKKNISARISNEKAEYKSLAFDENGEQLLYLATRDTLKIEQKIFDVRYFRNGNDSAVVLAGRNTPGLPEKWIFNEFSAPRFSKNGERIILGAAPRQAPKDTSIVDFEMAELDIWRWQDPLIQPQQLTELKNKQRQTYTGMILPNQPNRFIPIANEQTPFCNISDEGNGRFALLWSDEPYQVESQWDISSKNDVWVWDSQTEQLQTVATPLPGRPMISPKGNFVYWWDAAERQWFVYDNRDASVTNITGNIPVNFWDEKNDVPSDPDSYGIAAWGEHDEYIFINDAFDLWKIDPKGKKKPENISGHTGRNNSITFRYINTDPEKRFIEPGDLLLLSAFDKTTKQSGYYTLAQKGRNPLKKRIMDAFSFSSSTKAKDKDVYAFQKSNFHTSPNLYVTRTLWQSDEKLTDINPQMHEYNWGTAELFAWTSFTGVPHQGIVYKPENFDPAEKYPVMIYFYEQHSDNLYNYFAPAPSRSTINIPFFVSRGYIVFTPDIHYTTGRPGMDAYNSVVAGAEALAQNSWVDKENMAIQGQSWGGYQVAYLVTKTKLFKAAGAGAPVSNMTSAYGGIRWESGRSRQFQYEQTQSRIGAPMSDSLHLYIENSPVFYAENVNTPLLIMHNDKDGAVPWYQGIEYFMALRRLGKPVWMLQYNNEAHNLRERRNSKDLSIRLQQFFDHYLKGAPAPVWMTKGIPAMDKGKTWGYEIDAGNVTME
ncbi:MAG: prolyl oligopeptidase family serine peptidase [Proteiniphilum sp.]|jgi:dipeptidyl aminopeptidase/acylaminoacyl peptidase|nr:prolyl oligopeptidase family serine peptidase [Proteiniphilum sp.]